MSFGLPLVCLSRDSEVPIRCKLFARQLQGSCKAVARQLPVTCRFVATKTHVFFSYLLVVMQKIGLKRGGELPLHHKVDLQVEFVFL